MNIKERIMSGVIELVTQKQTTHISITDLCRHIQISRRSFYNYFLDKYDVIEEIFICRIEKTILSCLKNDVKTEDCLIQMYYSFLKDRDFFIVAIKETGQNSLFDTMIIRTKDLFQKLFQSFIADDKELDYLSYKYASSQAMLLKKWIQDGMKESPQFMTRIYLASLKDDECRRQEILDKYHQSSSI